VLDLRKSAYLTTNASGRELCQLLEHGVPAVAVKALVERHGRLEAETATGDVEVFLDELTVSTETTSTYEAPSNASVRVVAETPGLREDVHACFTIQASALPAPDVGVDTPVWLAISPGLQGIAGTFFVDRKPVQIAEHTTDISRCDQLWDRTAYLLGMSLTLAPTKSRRRDITPPIL
jgi:hypothetical protein